MTEVAQTANKNEKAGKPSLSRAKLITIILVVLLAVAGVSSFVWLKTLHSNAWNDYSRSYSEFVKARGGVFGLVDELSDYTKNCEDTLEDKELCSDISQAHDSYTMKAMKKLSKDTSRAQLVQASQTLAQDTKTLKNHMKDLEKLMERIEAARLAKTEKDYNNAHDTLDAKIQELQDLINATEGKVTDNKTREEAQNTINTATEVLNQKAGDTYEDKNQAKTQLEQQTQAIQTAIDTLNQNHDAWNQQQAQAAAAQAATKNNTTTSANNNYNNYSSGNTYTPPANNTSGSKSSNNNTSIWDDWTNFSGGEMPCQAVGTCQ